MNRNEIIEWGARRLFNLENESLWSRADELTKQKYIMEATVCMSHPDLYLKKGEISENVAQTASESDTYVAAGETMAMVSCARTAHVFKAFKEMGYVRAIPMKED